MGKKLFRIGLVVFLLNIIFIINTSFSVSATTIDVKWGSTVNYQQQYDELFNAVAHQPYTGKGSLNSVAVSNSG